MKLLVVAGEVSGDQHASALLAALKERVPALKSFGVGGEGCRREDLLGSRGEVDELVPLGG